MSSSSNNDHSKSSQTSFLQWSSQSQSRPSRRGLAPISTSPAPFSSSTRPPSSASTANRNPWSPTNPSLTSTTRQPARSSSISSNNGHFSPPPGIAQSSAGTTSSRTRTHTASTSNQFATSSNSQASGAGPFSTRVSRASPSVSSPGNALTPAQAGAAQAGNLSKIVIAQLFLLLSTLKEDGDKTKWESQLDQIRKLVDSNGMEVFAKYFRRLLSTNAPQIFNNGRPSDNGSSYQVLLLEVQKILKDAHQASKIAESIDQGDGDTFKDFDLSSFMEHFKLNAVAKVVLASAFKKASRSDLRTKADAILSNNLTTFMNTYARSSALSHDRDSDIPASVIASLVDRLAQYPPRNWTNENLQTLQLVIHQHYQNIGMLVPLEIASATAMFDLLAPHNPLARLLHRSGTKATESVDACKSVLEGIELQDISYQQVANALLFMVISWDESRFDPKVFISALREHRGGQRLDWQDVVHAMDREGIKVTKEQFKGLYDALTILAREYENFDIQLLWGGDWHFAETQMSFASAFLSFSETELDASQIPRIRPAYSREDFDDAPESPSRIQEFVDRAIKHPMVSLDASRALFNMVFRSSETYAHAQSLGVVENVINPNMDLFVCSVSAVPKPWGALQDQAVKQLISPMLLKSFETYGFVLHLLWKRDKSWMLTRVFHWWQNNQLNLSLIYEHAKERDWLTDIVAQNNELSLDLAALAHGKGEYNLDEWLDQITRAMPGPRVLAALSSFLKTRAENEIAVQREGAQPANVPLTVRTVHALLNFLGSSGLPEDDQVMLQRTCITAYPRLINYGEGYDSVIDGNGANSNQMSAETDARMQEFYKQMYSAEKQVRDIVEVLQKYKVSEEPGEQDLFACMIYGLFDEFGCFAEYPLDALATTAVLFGSIINFHLLSRIALKTALAMVLEAVRDYSPGEPMYKFGLQALLHFKDRLSEWRMFSERLLHVPGLRGTQIYPIAERVVNEMKEEANGDADGQDASDMRNVDDFLGPDVPEFSCLGVDAPLRPDMYEDPSEQTQENVLFILNNVSERNLVSKVSELRSKLQEEHVQWFANYLVEQRIKSQPNFHKLYMDILGRLDDDVLWEEVLRESYITSFRMLNAEATMSSTTERALLKNLGTWLGNLTLARDRPIKHRNIAFKDLLLEALDSQRLLVVIPFVCAALKAAAQSAIFKLPCAWTEEIVSILLEFYDDAEMKVSLKFEVEILSKALGFNVKKAERSSLLPNLRNKSAHDEEMLAALAAENGEGLNEMPIMTLGRRGILDRLPTSTVVPELADLGSKLKHNYSLPPGLAYSGPEIRDILNKSTENAVQEIVRPVVDRSVTIAAISTSQLVAKDFSTDSDPAKYQEAAHTTVRSLAGSLALVTCKDPLKTNIYSNAKAMSHAGTDEIAESTVVMFINDNLDTICSIIEKAAEQAAIHEIDDQIEEALQARRNGEFVAGELPRWNGMIPEPFRQSQDGLNAHQLAIYTEFGRSGRSAAAHSSNLSQDSRGQIPDILQEQFAGILPISTPGDSSSLPRQIAQYQQSHFGSSHTPGSQHTSNGFPDAGTVSELLGNLKDIAGNAVAADPGCDLLSIDVIRSHWRQLANPLNLSQHQQLDTYGLAVGREILALLYEDQIHPQVSDLLVSLLATFCARSEYVRQDFFRAFRSDPAYAFYPDIVYFFLKHRLLDLRVIDNNCAAALADGPAEQCALAIKCLDGLADRLLPNVGTNFLRADLLHSMSQLAKYRKVHVDDESARMLASKLSADLHHTDSPPVDSGIALPAQLEYVLDEWVRFLSNCPTHEEMSGVLRELLNRQTFSTHEGRIEFIRTAVEACLKRFQPFESKYRDSGAVLPISETHYAEFDALAKLIVALTDNVRVGDDDDLITSRVRFFKSLTLPAMLSFVHWYRHNVIASRAFFRLTSSIICELQDAASGIPEVHQECLVVIAQQLHTMDGNTFPGLAYAWLGLVSHRVLMLNLCGHEDSKTWPAYCSLLKKALAYIGELAKALDMTDASKELYRGMLKTLLIMHHDFADFLADNHYELLSALPVHCVQMRSLIVSAATASFAELPDPFNGLNMQDLAEMQHVPRVLGQLETPLIDAGIDQELQTYFKQPSASAASSIASSLSQDKGNTGVNYVPINHDVQALSALPLFLAVNLDTEALHKALPDSTQVRLLLDICQLLSPEGKYYLISAMANELRYPNAHTKWFREAFLTLWKAEVEAREVITRVLLERLIVHRPHPWGLIVTLLEFLRNDEYDFWRTPCITSHPEIESMFRALFGQMSQR